MMQKSFSNGGCIYKSKWSGVSVPLLNRGNAIGGYNNTLALIVFSYPAVCFPVVILLKIEGPQGV